MDAKRASHEAIDEASWLMKPATRFSPSDSKAAEELRACMSMVRLPTSKRHFACAVARSESRRSCSCTMSTSRAWGERRRTKDSRALRRMACETMSWSSEEENDHWAASKGRPFHGIGVESKVMMGGGVSAGGVTKAVDLWGVDGACMAA